MEAWTLHWLEASGELTDHRRALSADFEATYEALCNFMPPPRLDILIERLSGQTIPEIGMVGHAYRDTMFAMTVDPANPNFLPSLRAGVVRRQILHEVHHCLRMAGPGYGRTLGEALVSEGLAGQFVRYLLGSEPEPWECAVSIEVLHRMPVDRLALHDTEYNHAEWFFGSGSRPRWLGYTLGYVMVGCWLASAGNIDAVTWITVPAETIIVAAVDEGLVSNAA